MALLKATQPQADLSLQTLIFRIEQLERRLGGEPVEEAGEEEPEAAAPQPAPAAAPPRGGGPSAAVAVEPREQEVPRPAGAVDLEQVKALWPAVAETVSEENGMLGAAIGAATPTALDGERLTVAFPADAAFVKKKAEANRELVATAVRGLTGHSLVLAYELSDDALGPDAATLDHDQLIERLREEFGAEEVFDEPEEEKR
jgi:DNA polymerase-3 subunit gamma/tau